MKVDHGPRIAQHAEMWASENVLQLTNLSESQQKDCISAVAQETSLPAVDVLSALMERFVTTNEQLGRGLEQMGGAGQYQGVGGQRTNMNPVLARIEAQKNDVPTSTKPKDSAKSEPSRLNKLTFALTSPNSAVDMALLASWIGAAALITTAGPAALAVSIAAGTAVIGRAVASTIQSKSEDD